VVGSCETRAVVPKRSVDSFERHLNGQPAVNHAACCMVSNVREQAAGV
jgi:hypothetical protein